MLNTKLVTVLPSYYDHLAMFYQIPHLINFQIEVTREQKQREDYHWKACPVLVISQLPTQCSLIWCLSHSTLVAYLYTIAAINGWNKVEINKYLFWHFLYLHTKGWAWR